METSDTPASGRTVLRSHVPSRSEGIETEETVSQNQHSVLRSHVPSRSEGMETYRFRTHLPRGSLFTRAFPFGGNGNIETRGLFSRQRCCSHVPSRSEGMETFPRPSPDPPKVFGSHVPSRSEGIETVLQFFVECVCSFCTVHTCLPVRREWKLNSPLSNRFRWKSCSHVPSRSEGIETYKG